MAVALAAACGSGGSTTIGGSTETPEPTAEPTPTTAPIGTTTTAATTTSSAPPTVAEVRRVAIVGDSITVQSTEALEAAIEGDVTIAAVTGARTIDMTADAARLAAGTPDVMIINLGTNDEACATVGGCSDGYRPNAADVAEGLHRIVDPFTGSCRLGVTIAYNLEQPPMTNPALTTMREDGTLHGVIDWAGHWRDHQPDDEQWLVDFMGHLSPTGAERLAALVAHEADRFCGAGA